MLFGFLLFIIFVILLLWILVLQGRINDLLITIDKKNEFIEQHLYVVDLDSKEYVFPYVWGTKQSLVFYVKSSLPDEVATKILSPEEARRRIEAAHLAHAEMRWID